MESQHFENVMAFLESENADQGIDRFIQELKFQDKIHTRTYVIALNIHYQLHNREKEYDALTYSPAEYEQVLSLLFQVKSLSTSLYKVIRFDYKKVLKDPRNKGRSQLKRQFEQIINTPEVFNKDIIKRAKEIYEKHFTKDR